MASAPVGVHPAVSIVPVATPGNLAPAAIRANRANIAPEPNPDGPQLSVVPAAPVVPAPSMHPSVPAVDTPPFSTHALANDPALAAFLEQPPEATHPAAPDSGVTAPLAAPSAAAPADPAPQPVPTISFADIFDTPAPVDTPAPSAELTEMREQLAAMTELLQNRPSAPEPAQVDLSLSAEEQEAYGDAIPVIRRVAEAYVSAARSEFSAAIESMRAEMQQSLSGLQSGVGEFRKDSYTQQLRVSVPDIDQLTNHPQFQQFLAQPVPYSGGETIKSRLATAHRASDLPKVIEIMKDFRAAVAGSSGVPVVPDITAMSVPATSVAPAAPANNPPENVRKLPWSKRQEAYREHRAGRMPAADFQKIDQAYRVADAKQMVDFLA